MRRKAAVSGKPRVDKQRLPGRRQDQRRLAALDVDEINLEGARRKDRRQRDRCGERHRTDPDACLHRLNLREGARAAVLLPQFNESGGRARGSVRNIKSELINTTVTAPVRFVPVTRCTPYESTMIAFLRHGGAYDKADRRAVVRRGRRS